MDTPTNTRKMICYLVKTFPKVSETFILQEILALEQDGYPLHIVSLQKPTDERSHHEVRRVRAQVDYLDRKTLYQPDRIAGLLLFVLGNPLGLWKFIALLIKGAPWPDGGVQRFVQAIALAKLVREKNMVHVHAHFASTPTTVAELVKAFCGTGYSISAHAKDIYLSAPEELQRKISAARFVVTCTEYNRQYLERINQSSTPVMCVYHGFDFRRFGKYLTAAIASPAECPLILTVGRLREKKGFDLLIAACALLQQTGCRFRCEIVGYGPERDALQKQIDDLDLAEMVILRGQLIHKELIRLYHQASIFALPCRIGADGDRDGIPNVLMEAMAMGVPVVTTPVSGIPELVQDRVSGLLVEPDQPRKLADALGMLLSDQSLRHRLGAAGKERVLAEFSLAPNLATLKTLFDSLMQERTRSPAGNPFSSPRRGGIAK